MYDIRMYVCNVCTAVNLILIEAASDLNSVSSLGMPGVPWQLKILADQLRGHTVGQSNK